MSPQNRRVLLYSGTLFGAPLLVMPFVPGTRDFALALLLASSVLIAGSLVMLWCERQAPGQSLLHRKLIAVSALTTLLGLALAVGSALWLGGYW